MFHMKQYNLYFCFKGVFHVKHSLFFEIRVDFRFLKEYHIISILNQKTLLIGGFYGKNNFNF